mgnify:FL=1
MFKDKQILIAGGNGLIGRQLVDLLLEKGSIITVADLKDSDNPQIRSLQLDLTNYENCLTSCTGMD